MIILLSIFYHIYNLSPLFYPTSDIFILPAIIFVPRPKFTFLLHKAPHLASLFFKAPQQSTLFIKRFSCIWIYKNNFPGTLKTFCNDTSQVLKFLYLLYFLIFQYIIARLFLPVPYTWLYFLFTLNPIAPQNLINLRINRNPNSCKYVFDSATNTLIYRPYYLYRMVMNIIR